MSFAARLRPELIRIAPPWRTFEETIAGLVALLAAGGLLPAASEGIAIQAVIAREATASTALLDIQAGVPHARLHGIAEPVAALATSPHGFYEAVPTVPIHLVALVLSPPAATARHLTILAGIATLLRSADLRAGLLAARDGDEALHVLRRHAREPRGLGPP
jgi:mannitol/fructose-specific phosphotransferase system IIA component (Ntr-type)